jgi:mannosylglycoprotein endo-beta-mannosidase
MFQDFHKGELDIRRLNYGVITLVPKVQEANTMKQYRPICLLNVDYKGFTKVLTERLTPVAKEIVGENQSGFIKGRNILEGVVNLHEVLHSLSRDKGNGMIFKIYFEKAYDRVRWDFLEEVLLGKTSLSNGLIG